MASRKVPKLVIKRHQTKKLDIPQGVNAEGKDGSDLMRNVKSLKRAATIRRMKNSLKSNAHLLAVGILAMIVMYGIASSLTESEGNGDDNGLKINKRGEKTENTKISPPPPGSTETATVVKQDGSTDMWVCVDAEKNIWDKITTGPEGTKKRRFIKSEKNGVAVYSPYKPEKPKEVIPTDQLDGITGIKEGTIPQ